MKSQRQEDKLDIIDEYIPLWRIIFHGTVLSCPSASAVNTVFNDDPDAMLKTIEYGGRPAIYYYSRFKTGGNDWIGAGDFTLNTLE